MCGGKKKNVETKISFMAFLIMSFNVRAFTLKAGHQTGSGNRSLTSETSGKGGRSGEEQEHREDQMVDTSYGG